MASPPDLLQALDDLGTVPWNGEAFRHTAPTRPALSGGGASAFGGRWNKKGTTTIYIASPAEACLGEFMRMAQGQARGLQSFLPRDLHTIEVSGLELLDLRNATARASVGISLADIEGNDRTRCQEVGDAARYLGVQGVLAPSAAQIGVVIAVFERNIRRGQLLVRDTRPLDSLLSLPDMDLPDAND